MNEFARNAPVFGAVVAAAQLIQGAAVVFGGWLLLYFELHDVDVVAQFNRQICLSDLGDVFGDDFGIDGTEVSIKYGGVVALELGQAVVGIVAPGHPGKHAFDGCHQPLDLSVDEVLVYAGLYPSPFVGLTGVGADELVVEGLADFLVGDAQGIHGALQPVKAVFYGEIARLKQQGDGVDVPGIEAIEDFFGYFQLLELRQEVFVLLEQANQVGGAAGFEPIVAVGVPLADEKKHIIGVVNGFASRPAVAIVPLLHFLAIHAFQMRSKAVIEVVLGVATNAGVFFAECEVFELVDAAEQADFGEFGDPRHEYQLQVGVLFFEDGVEAFEFFLHLSRYAGARHVVKYRLVVFIHQYHHKALVLLAGALYEASEGLGDAAAQDLFPCTLCFGVVASPVPVVGCFELQPLCVFVQDFM